MILYMELKEPGVKRQRVDGGLAKQGKVRYWSMGTKSHLGRKKTVASYFIEE